MTPEWWDRIHNTHVPPKYELAGVKSLMHPSDAEIIKKLMADCNEKFDIADSVVLDIGTYYGASAILLAKHGHFEVITVDPNCRIDAKGNRGPIQTERVAEVISNFRRHGVEGRIRRLDGLSEDIIWPRYLKIPFLMIDGNHHLLNVLHEYSYFSRFVPVGGYIAFHDYGKPNWPGVQRVVEEAVRFDGYSVAEQEGFLVVLRKDE